MTEYPFGADTLIIPFTMTGASPNRGRTSGMTRMRRPGELFRYGVVNTASAQQDVVPSGSTSGVDQTGDGTAR